MDPDLLVTKLHGYAGVVAFVAATAAWWTARAGAPDARLVRAAFVASTLSMLAGAAVLAPYRLEIKPTLFFEAHGWAMAFEAKVHLAMFAWFATTAALVVAERVRDDAGPGRRVASLRRLCGVAALFFGLAGLVGTGVASTMGF
jgi:hypothetical protein